MNKSLKILPLILIAMIFDYILYPFPKLILIFCKLIKWFKAKIPPSLMNYNIRFFIQSFLLILLLLRSFDIIIFKIYELIK